jgi:hypothetical protein
MPEELDPRLIKKAQKRVKAKKDFRAHLVSYSIIIGFLFVLNMITSPYVKWFIYPALGWGIGLAFHYFAAYGILSDDSDEWEERELQKEIAKLQRTKNESGFEGEDDYLELDERPQEKMKEKNRRWDDRDFV